MKALSVQPREKSHGLKRATSRSADLVSNALIQVSRQPNLASRFDRSHGFFRATGFAAWKIVYPVHEDVPGQMATAPIGD